MHTGALAMASDHLDSYPTCTVSKIERTADNLPRMLAQSLKRALKSRHMIRARCTRNVKLDRLDSYPTCMVSKQKSYRIAEPRMLAQSLKHAFKTHPTICTPVHSLWLARSTIALTGTLLAWSRI